MSAAIINADARLFRLPLPVILSDSTHGDIVDFELIVVTLKDDDGVEGVGYTYTVGHGGCAILALLRHEIAGVIDGQDSAAIEGVLSKVNSHLHWGGRGGATALAVSALDTALWDMMGKRTGQPFWRLLGGYDPQVPCYAGGIDLDFSIKALLSQTDDFLASGIRAIKMKAGRKNLSEDVERCAAMRQHLGPDFPLMIDANMGWTVPQAIQAGRALEPFNLVWMEEPINPDDIDGHRKIVDSTAVPIATGENLRSLAEFRHLIQAGGVHYPEPDFTNCGGISAFMKIGRLAEAFNLPVTSHGAHDVTVHLLAACPNRSFLELHGFSIDPYIENPVELRDGKAIAPDRPGHGVAFRWDVLDEFES